MRRESDALKQVRLKRKLLLGGPITRGGSNRPAVRTVADMPPQMRVVCEHLANGHTAEQGAAAMDISVTTFHYHANAAQKRTGMPDRASLVKWCKRGGQIRWTNAPPAYPSITVRGADGATMVDVMALDAAQQLARRHPEILQRAYVEMRDKRTRDRERAQKASQDAPGSIAGGPEDVRGRAFPSTRPVESAQDSGAGRPIR